MEPSTMMAVSQGVSAIFGIFQGIGAQKQAELDAFNIGTEKQMARASAMQQTRYRDDQLREALAASNNFFMAQASREITADIEAFERKERNISGEDISNIELMDFLNQSKMTMEQAQVRRKGRETLLASIVRAGGQLASAYDTYKDVAPPQRTVPRRSYSPRPRLRA